MGEIFGLRIHLSYVHPPQTFFLIPPCKKHVNFISEFDNFGKNPPVYDVKNILKFLHVHGGMSKKISRPLFIIFFRPKMVEFPPYSILTW